MTIDLDRIIQEVTESSRLAYVSHRAAAREGNYKKAEIWLNIKNSWEYLLDSISDTSIVIVANFEKLKDLK